MIHATAPVKYAAAITIAIIGSTVELGRNTYKNKTFECPEELSPKQIYRTSLDLIDNFFPK